MSAPLVAEVMVIRLGPAIGDPGGQDIARTRGRRGRCPCEIRSSLTARRSTARWRSRWTPACRRSTAWTITGASCAAGERWRRDHAKTEIRQPTRRSDLLRVTMLVTPRDGLTCQRGHRIEGDNLYERQDGTRQCRTCRLEVMRAYHRTRMRASRSA